MTHPLGIAPNSKSWRKMMFPEKYLKTLAPPNHNYLWALECFKKVNPSYELALTYNNMVS